MNSVSQHPLVRRYLADVEIALSDSPPDERREAIAGLEEHLLSALPENASDSDVHEVLNRLGAPSDLAADSPSQRRRTLRSALEGRWVPVLAGLVLVLMFLWLAAMGLFIESRTSSQVCSGGPEGTSHCQPEQIDPFLPRPGALFSVFVALFPYAIIPYTLILASRLWSPRARVVLLSAIPAWTLLVDVPAWAAWKLGASDSLVFGLTQAVFVSGILIPLLITWQAVKAFRKSSHQL